MRYLAILATILLAGCGDVVISPTEVKTVLDACEAHGGASVIWTGSAWTGAICKDGLRTYVKH